MKFNLKDDGYPWRVIYQGRQKVGRVWQHVETKVYHAMIDKTEATGESFSDAFRNVVAKELGYASVQALHNHNATVRAKNRLIRQTADVVVDEMLRGNFEPFGKALEHPGMAPHLISSATRKIFK